jgi:hypothetical protein
MLLVLARQQGCDRRIRPQSVQRFQELSEAFGGAIAFLTGQDARVQGAPGYIPVGGIAVGGRR